MVSHENAVSSNQNRLIKFVQTKAPDSVHHWSLGLIEDEGWIALDSIKTTFILHSIPSTIHIRLKLCTSHGKKNRSESQTE